MVDMECVVLVCREDAIACLICASFNGGMDGSKQPACMHQRALMSAMNIVCYSMLRYTVLYDSMIYQMIILVHNTAQYMCTI
jgi:hypothetical protein